MPTADQIRERLEQAEQTVAAGKVNGDPQRYVEALWAELLDEAPAETRVDTYDRLLELAARLGLPQPSVPQARLASPRWDAFLDALAHLPDPRVDELAFWRALDEAKGPLFDGVTEEDGEVLEAAVQAALNERGLAIPGDDEP